MALGTELKVGINEYVKSMSVAGYGNEAKSVQKVLESYGVSGEVSVYQGSSPNDGNILFGYTMKDGARGYLCFGASGLLFDMMDEKVSSRGLSSSNLANVNGAVARILIGSLFPDEIVPEPQEKTLLGGLNMVRGCYAKGQGECQESAVRETFAQREKDEISSHLRLGQLAWSKAARFVELARSEDKWPGGIDWTDLRDILQSAMASRSVDTTTLEGAKLYHKQGVEVLDKMFSTYSGRATAEERAGDMSCEFEEDTKPSGTCPTGYHKVERSAFLRCSDLEELFFVWITNACFEDKKEERESLLGKGYRFE